MEIQGLDTQVAALRYIRMSFKTPADLDQLCSHDEKAYIIAETMQYSVMHSHLAGDLTVLR